MKFVGHDSRLQYNTYNGGKPFKRESQVNLDSETGKELSQQNLGVSQWQEATSGNRVEAMKRKVSFVDLGSNRALYSFQTSNTFDIWRLSPNGKRLWVALAKQNRFNILDAKTGRKLWSLSSIKSPGGQIFDRYPSWEGGGETLATIENDTLILRDGSTGQVLLRHKNNLSAPLRSWAFTRDGNAAYLLDDKGEIFRQRLK